MNVVLCLTQLNSIRLTTINSWRLSKMRRAAGSLARLALLALLAIAMTQPATAAAVHELNTLRPVAVPLTSHRHTNQMFNQTLAPHQEVGATPPGKDPITKLLDNTLPLHSTSGHNSKANTQNPENPGQIILPPPRHYSGRDDSLPPRLGPADCDKATGFISRAASARDTGMSAGLFLTTLERDMTVLLARPPANRWFVQSEAEASMIRIAAVGVFNHPRDADTHARRFSRICRHYLRSKSGGR